MKHEYFTEKEGTGLQKEEGDPMPETMEMEAKDSGSGKKTIDTKLEKEMEKPNKPDSPQSSSTSSDHTDRDGINWGTTQNRKDARDLKDYHDSVVHKVVRDNNPERLKELLSKGLVAYGKSIDGATPLHRAAENGSIACAKILLDHNVEINQTNLAG